MLASSYGWAGLGLTILLVLGTVWAFVRWIRKAGMDRQQAEDAVQGLRREKATLEAKLRVAILALEVIRETKRDPVTGLPAGLLQPRQKPDDRPVGQPPAG